MRRAAKSSEHQEQVAVIDWWRLACKGYGLPEFALMAIPNAAKRSYALAAYMKAEGLRKGVPDLFLAASNSDELFSHGLWIELKRKPNKPSPEQLEVLNYFETMDFTVSVCYSADEAIKAIRDYLK